MEPFLSVKVWIRRLVALSLLPPDLVWSTIENYLQPPITNDATVDANIRGFCEYFSRQWLKNQQQVEIWNHYTNEGPRTTNAAEGYNNSLSTKFDHLVHPNFSVFLVFFREIHHEKQVRVRQLRRGTADPVVRVPQYVENDRRIEAAKATLAAKLATTQHRPIRRRRVILRYLDRVQKLIGEF